MTAYQTVVEALERSGHHIVRRGDRRAAAQCPAHEDRNPSLSVTGIEGQVLLHCHSGCQTERVLATLGLTARDLFDDPRGATYRYTDVDGAVLRTVHRSPEKRFRQSGDTKAPAPLYNLPGVAAAVAKGETIYLVEGEKDVHAVEALGATATTTPQGANSFAKADHTPLAGAEVIAIVDQDDAGSAWAATVREALGPIASSITFAAPAEGKDAADHLAAGHQLDALRPFVLPGPGDSWRDVDLSGVVSAVVDGTYQRPQPTLVPVTDGKALLYPGRVHGVHGVGGAGKTWLSAFAIADRIRARQHCVFVDLEDTPATLIERLVIDLRCDPADVLTHLHYKSPSEPSALGTAQLQATVRGHHVALVVLDSVGEGLASEGVKQNEDDEVARWMRRVARSVADLGPAVLLIDHVPKSDENTLMPIGSHRKQAAMNGVVYSVQVKEPFSRETAGHADIVCGKDRLGAYKRGEVVAEMHVTPRGDGGSDVTLTAHRATGSAHGTFRPTTLMEKISRFLEQNPGAGKNDIRKGVPGKSEAKERALAVLITEGYVTTADGPRRSILHTIVRAYRQSDPPGAQSPSDADRDRARALREGHGAQSHHCARAHPGHSGGQSPVAVVPPLENARVSLPEAIGAPDTGTTRLDLPTDVPEAS